MTRLTTAVFFLTISASAFAASPCPKGQHMEDGECVENGTGGPPACSVTASAPDGSKICGIADANGLTYASAIDGNGNKHEMIRANVTAVSGVGECHYFWGTRETLAVNGTEVGTYSHGLCLDAAGNEMQQYAVTGSGGRLYEWTYHTNQNYVWITHATPGSVTTDNFPYDANNPDYYTNGGSRYIDPEMTPFDDVSQEAGYLSPILQPMMSTSSMGGIQFQGLPKWVAIVSIVGNLSCGLAGNMVTNPTGWNVYGFPVMAAAAFVCGAGMAANYFLVSDYGSGSGGTIANTGDFVTTGGGDWASGRGDCLNYGPYNPDNPCVPYKRVSPVQ